MPDFQERFYTTREVAELLRVREETVRTYARRGTLHSVQLGGPGGPLRFPESSLRVVIETGRAPDGTPLRPVIAKPRRRTPSYALFTRRQVVLGALTAVGAPAIGGYLSLVLWELTPWRRTEPSVGAPAQPSLPATGSRPDPASPIFDAAFGRLEGNATILGGHRYSNQLVHPDNLAAGMALRGPLGLQSPSEIPVPRSDVMPALPDGDMVVVGGPVSTPQTRLIWELEGPNDRELDRSRTPILPLRWCTLSNEKDPRLRSGGQVSWRMERVGRVSTANWEIVDSVTGYRLRPQLGDGAAQPLVSTGTRSSTIDATRDGHLPKDNYLLVTMLPNFLHPDFLRQTRSEWKRVIMFTGNHGIGTRAAELLREGRGLQLLESVKHRVQGGTGFQLLFHVKEIRLTDDTEQGFHRFCAIDLVDVAVLDERAGFTLSRYRKAHKRGVALWPYLPPTAN